MIRPSLGIASALNFMNEGQASVEAPG